jgi:phi13 family phage major tail protein
MATPLAGVIGLSNLVAWQLQTDTAGGTTTYGAPFSLAAAAEMSFDPASSQTPYFADDSLTAIGSTTGFRKVGIKLYDIDPANLGILIGQTYANGQLVDKGADQSPYFAIAGKVLRNGGAYSYVVFYKCQLMKPKSDFKTKGATINFVEVQLDGASAALQSNGQYWNAQRSDDPNGTAAAISAWFTTPQFSTTDNSALSVVFAAGGTAKTITATFSKASASGTIPFTMADPTTITALVNEIQVVKSVAAGAGTGAVLTWVLTTPGAGFSNNTILFTGTVVSGATTADNVTVSVRANSAVKDNNGIAVTAVGKGYLTLA